jgi:hypothetical protein
VHCSARRRRIRGYRGDPHLEHLRRLEVDHLQYGLFGAAPPPPPTSATSPIPTRSDVALASLALVAAAFGLAMLKIRRA